MVGWPEKVRGGGALGAGRRRVGDRDGEPARGDETGRILDPLDQRMDPEAEERRDPRPPADLLQPAAAEILDPEDRDGPAGGIAGGAAVELDRRATRRG